jgi:hypothetical protein
MSLPIHSSSVPYKVKGPLLALFVILVGAIIPDSPATDLSTDDDVSEPSPHVASGGPAAPFKERKAAFEELKTNLEAAKTPEAKRAVLNDFRTKQEIFLKQARPLATEQKSPEVRFAELKARANGNPEMLARVNAMEARLKSVETIKAKLNDARNATGEEKAKIIQDIRRTQTQLVQGQPAEMESRLQTARARSASSAKDLPPQMAAMKAKGEARQQELDQLRESLAQASPQERLKLLDAWRAKWRQERAGPSTKPQQPVP